MNRVLAVTAGATLIGAFSAATAFARPVVSFSLASTANAGAAIPFVYSARGVPAGNQTVIQRQEGTAHVWRTLARLRASAAGSGRLPGMSLGQYQTRIAVLGAHAKVVAQQIRRLSIFGDVPFGTLFAGSDRGLGSGVYTTATGTFPFVLGFYNGSVNFTAFTVTSNPCRTVNIAFVTAPPSQGEDLSQQQATVSLVQESANPVAVTVPGGSVGSLRANVVPGQSWGLNLSQGSGENFLFTWYFNGSASCDQATLTAHEPGF